MHGVLVYFSVVVVVLVSFFYLFNNLATKVTVRTRKTYEVPPRFSALLPIWPLLLVEI